jgi:UPF0716 protein FxsA
MVRFVAGLWPIIALAFPLLELYGIVTVWHWIGAWTLLWLLASALAGIALIATEQRTFMPRMAGAMMGGGNPFGALKGIGLRFMAGALLLFPGFFSDILAGVFLLVALFLPEPVMGRRGEGPEVGRGPGKAANDDVIEGEFRRMD